MAKACLAGVEFAWRGVVDSWLLWNVEGLEMSVYSVGFLVFLPWELMLLLEGVWKVNWVSLWKQL